MSNVFTIPFGQPFLETLAGGIVGRFAANPLLLAKTLVILPTRRGCLGLKEAFLNRRNSQVLPRIIALADLEHEPNVPGFIPPPLPTAIPSAQQLGILSQLVLKKDPTSLANAFNLAKELMALIDEIHTSDIEITKLQTLVGNQFAQHWQQTLDFLKIITDYWPAILREHGMLDDARRRRDNLRLLAHQWQPGYPVILAGTTATRPATLDLAKAILRFPQGMLVLPGFIPKQIEDELPATHPLHTLHQFTKRLRVTDVQQWVQTESPNKARGTLLQQAMSPVITLPPSFSPAEKREISTGVVMVECRDIEHESLVIALKIRQALAEGLKSIAVITPDIELTRRLQIQLNRWSITANSSHGTPLSKTVVGNFLCLIAQFCSTPNPRGLLALLKHPLCYRHLNRGEHLSRVRRLDLNLRHLRQPNLLSPNFASEEDRDWYRDFLSDILPAEPEHKQSLKNRIHHLIKAAETLCLPEKLWTDSDGQLAHDFFVAFEPHTHTYPFLTSGEFQDLLPQLMDQVLVHDREGIGSPVRILGTLEARQAHAPLMILAGLNETTWPQLTTTDPWLNRQMRIDLGLPDPLRRIGLSAHDFCLGFSAPEVMLTRSLKENGTATVPSRWWLRLETLLAIHNIEINRGEQLKSWATALDAPLIITPATEPQPCPALDSRPHQFSTTDIEQLMRDPFGYYARRILKLRKLDLPDKELSPRDLGNLIHKSLDAYHRSHGNIIDPDKLLACGEAAFSAYIHDPHARYFWWPRFTSIAQWLTNEWQKRQPQAIYTETDGSLEIDYGNSTPAIIRSIADRIEVGADTAVIIDYKTGSDIPVANIVSGLSPQLAIEAMLLEQGGFKETSCKEASGLEYWYLKGNQDSKIKQVKDPRTLIDNASQGIKRLLHHFLLLTTPYICAPWGDSESKLKNRDYLHLARFEEWNI